MATKRAVTMPQLRKAAHEKKLRATQAEPPPPPTAPRMNDGVSCRMSTETRHQYEAFCTRQLGAFTPSDLLRLGAAMLYRNLQTLEVQIAMLCGKVVPKQVRDDASVAGLRAVLRVMGSSMAKVTIASEVLACGRDSFCCWAVGEGLTVRYGCTRLSKDTEPFWKALKYQTTDSDLWQDDLATWLAERGIGVAFSFGEG